MQTPTQQLREVYPEIIDRLDALYSHGLQHTFTAAEQAEIHELRQRAGMIHTELAQRERFTTSLTA